MPAVYAPTIPAHKMEEIACQFMTSGLSALEFARRNGLTEHQSYRLNKIAAANARPSGQLVAEAGKIVTSVSGQVLKTVETLALKAKAALDAAAETWVDGTMPDPATQKSIEWAARMLTLPLRFQRKPDAADPDGSAGHLPASSGGISV